MRITVQRARPRSIASWLGSRTMNGLRAVAAGFFFATMDGRDPPLAPDGRVDVYALLRPLDNPRDEIVRFCFSARAGKGPSAAEFEAGDYTNFPYQRRRGGAARGAGVTALVAWERQPTDGKRLVALADGGVLLQDEDVVQQFFRGNPGQE